jgi:hypothetical protein
MSWSAFPWVLPGTVCESVSTVILSSLFTLWVYPERSRRVYPEHVEGRPDLTASAVLQRIRGGRTTASCTAPCICGNLGS